MKLKIKKSKKLDEASAMSGGAVQGHTAPLGDPKTIDTHNKKEAKEQRLKGDRLDEMYSSSGLSGRNYRIRISGEKEHAGHLERSRHQGLRNVMEAEDTLPLGTIPLNTTAPSSSPAGQTQPEPEPDAAEAMRLKYPEISADIEAHGYEIISELGIGQFGTVFAAEDIQTGGDYVVKVIGIGESGKTIPPSSINREIENYKKVSEAASKDETLWKHFPETYDTWKSNLAGKNLGFIVMEKLVPLTPEESAFIPDVNDAVADHFMNDAKMVNDFGQGRDQSIKAKRFINNEFLDLGRKIRMIIEDLADPVYLGQGNPEIDQVAASLTPRQLRRFEMMQYSDPDKIDDVYMDQLDEMDINSGFGIRNYYDILSAEIETGTSPDSNSYEFVLVILLKLMNGMVKISDLALPAKVAAEEARIDKEIAEANENIQNMQTNSAAAGVSPEQATQFIDYYTRLIGSLQVEKGQVDSKVARDSKIDLESAIQKVATAYINGIRSTTAIPIGFTRRELNQTPEERERAGEMGRELFTAIRKLYDWTGLIAKDVHSENVMKREGGSDIVIVDLGLFKDDSAQVGVRESRNYRLKVLTKPRK